MLPVAPIDASFLYLETPRAHMHTLKVLVYSTREGFDARRDSVRNLVERHLVKLPTLRRVLHRHAAGHPYWVDDPDFDPARHIDFVELSGGGIEQLEAVVSQVASTPLPRDRPLWHITHALGLQGGRAAVIIKIHHAVADGSTFAEMLLRVEEGAIETGAITLPDLAPAPTPEQHAWKTLDFVHRAVQAIPRLGVDAVRNAGRVRTRRAKGHAAAAGVFQGANLSFNQPLTARRAFATARLSLPQLKAIKRAAGVSLNDAYLAVAGGALRGWLSWRDELPSREVTASVPIGTERQPYMVGPQANYVDSVFAPLGTSIDDPAERIQAVHRAMVAAKAEFGLREATGPEGIIDVVPPRAFEWAIRAYAALHLSRTHRPPVNLVVSNVPGPRRPLRIAGGDLVELYSVGPILEGMGLNLTGWSYQDVLSVGLLGCPDHGVDAAALRDLARRLEAEVDVLAVAVGA